MDEKLLTDRLTAVAERAGRAVDPPGPAAARRRGRRRQVGAAAAVAVAVAALVLAAPVALRALSAVEGVAPAGGGAEPTPTPSGTPAPLEPAPRPAGPVHVLASGTTGGRAWRFVGYRSDGGHTCVGVRPSFQQLLPNGQREAETMGDDCDVSDAGLGVPGNPPAPNEMVVSGSGGLLGADGKWHEQVWGLVVPKAVKVRLVAESGHSIEVGVVDASAIGLRNRLFAAPLPPGERHAYAVALDAAGRTVSCQGEPVRMSKAAACKAYLARYHVPPP
jgi:hypothetical protein